MYLREVLPRRFEVGRGMVYGLAQRSREADIVIWDAANYPSLPMQDHAFYFAESVRAVVEAKSGWDSRSFDDVLAKSRAVRDIVPTPAPDNLQQEIEMLRLEVASLKRGVQHSGMIWSQHHIGTAAVFLSGGSTALESEADLPPGVIEDADDSWPDLLLLLEAGRVAIKDYGDGEEPPAIVVYDCGEDGLLFFTGQLLRVVAERSVGTEGRFYFDHYMNGIQVTPLWSATFGLHRLLPGRTPLWHTGSTKPS